MQQHNQTTIERAILALNSNDLTEASYQLDKINPDTSDLEYFERFNEFEVKKLEFAKRAIEENDPTEASYQLDLAIHHQDYATSRNGLIDYHTALENRKPGEQPILDLGASRI